MSAKEEGEAVVEEKDGETQKENTDIPQESQEKSDGNEKEEQEQPEEGAEEKPEQNDEKNDEVDEEKGKEGTNPDEDAEAQTELLPKTDGPTEQTETSAQTDHDGKTTPDKASEVTSQTKETTSVAEATSVSEPNLVAPPASQIDVSSINEEGIKKTVEIHDVKGMPSLYTKSFEICRDYNYFICCFSEICGDARGGDH